MDITVWQGIIIGGAGGTIAGLTVWIVNYLHSKVTELIHKRRVYNWLSQNTRDQLGARFRSTRTIASYNNLTEDRVRYICSIDDHIALSTGQREDVWGIRTLVKDKDA